jgi:hypothetical protein
MRMLENLVEDVCVGRPLRKWRAGGSRCLRLGLDLAKSPHHIEGIPIGFLRGPFVPQTA